MTETEETFEEIIKNLVVEGSVRFDELGYLAVGRGYQVQWYLDDGVVVCGIARPHVQTSRLSLHNPKNLNILKECFLHCTSDGCVCCLLY